MPERHNRIIAAVMEQLMTEGPQGMGDIFTTLFNLAMRLEREQVLGAGHYERSSERIARLSPILRFNMRHPETSCILSCYQ